MKPALFSVLCEIKEKTGTLYIMSGPLPRSGDSEEGEGVDLWGRLGPP